MGAYRTVAQIGDETWGLAGECPLQLFLLTILSALKLCFMIYHTFSHCLSCVYGVAYYFPGWLTRGSMLLTDQKLCSTQLMIRMKLEFCILLYSSELLHCMRLIPQSCD